MTTSQLDLLAGRRFLPLFITQSLGAFNDNVFKNAIVFLVTFSMAQSAGLDAPLLVAAAAGIFIFPFFLFSANAGQLADKYDKAWLIRILKLTEIIIMVIAAAGFLLGNVWFLLAVLFLMGTQSTYFGPIKYGILPEQLKTAELIAGYARFANPYDFYSIRYVFTGAEKLRDETKKVYSERYGVRVFEGYGATEAAPVLAMNSPMHNKRGSVGQLSPGIQYRLEDVPGITEGGKLVVRGANVMAGYLRPEKPGQVQPPEDGWYDTGDIVSIDEHGYVTIQGRAKRFAKIAGEMVSLAMVEGEAAKLWPDYQHAAIARPDPKKGEQLVLVTSNPEADRAAFDAHARKYGIAAIAVPAKVLVVEDVPVLGTGKTDFRGVQTLFEATEQVKS